MTYAETDYRFGQQRAGSAWNGAPSRQYQQQAYYNSTDAMNQQKANAEAYERFQRAQEEMAYKAFFGNGNGTNGQRGSQQRPAVAGPVQWWVTLGVGPNASSAEIKSAYRKLAATAHPDKGGSTEAMAKLNAARDDAMRARKAA